MGKYQIKSERDPYIIRIGGFRISGWRLAAISAVGGTILTVFSSYVVDYFKQRNNSAIEQSKAANDAVKLYDALQDMPRRASVYIETGKEGSVSDVRAVARLFRSVLTDHSNGRYTSKQLRDNFGGRLQFWASQFRRLNNGTSPVSDKFSDNERKTFGFIAIDLSKITSSSSEIVEADAAEAALAAATAPAEQIPELEEDKKPAKSGQR